MDSCSFCKADSAEKLLKCGSFGGESYCSKECQAKDWTNHKASCPPYRVREVPGKGRGLFATRRIVPGKIILEERPLLTLDEETDGRMSFDTFKTHHYPNIDDETKAKILQLYDPAENLKTLDTDRVEQLIMKNLNLFCWKETSKASDEADKILRIFSCNAALLCMDPALYTTTQSGLFYQISRINHSCNPNACITWIMNDFQRQQVRAMKVIEKGEEIVINYQDKVKFNFGSREYRQKVMMEKMAFICSCSECSLEGEALLENERIRAEIRKKDLKTKMLVPQIQRLCGVAPAAQKRPLMELLQTSQAIVRLVKKLDIQLEIVNQLTKCFEDALQARMMGFSREPDPSVIKKEALEHAKKLGDGQMLLYNECMKRCGHLSGFTKHLK